MIPLPERALSASALHIASARTFSLDGSTRTLFNLPLPLLAAIQKGSFIFDHPDHVD